MGEHQKHYQAEWKKSDMSTQWPNLFIGWSWKGKWTYLVPQRQEKMNTFTCFHCNFVLTSTHQLWLNKDMWTSCMWIIIISVHNGEGIRRHDFPLKLKLRKKFESQCINYHHSQDLIPSGPCAILKMSLITCL